MVIKWKIGYTKESSMDKNILKKEELERLDTTDPDEVVEFIEDFYKKAEITNEEELVKELTKHKPLRTAIEIQQGKKR